MKTLRLTRLNCKQIAVFAGIVLMACWFFIFCREVSAKDKNGWAYENDIYATENQSVQVTLTGIKDFALMEVFHDIIVNTPGVVKAKRYRLHIDPRAPLASFVLWRVALSGIDIPEFESRVYRMARYISGRRDSFKEETFSFKLNRDQRLLLAGISPWRTSACSVDFLLRQPLRSAENDFGRPFYRNRSWKTLGNNGFE